MGGFGSDFSVHFDKCLKQATTASLYISSSSFITTPAFNATLKPINETGKKKWLNKPIIDHYQQFIVRLHEIDKP